MSIQLVNVSKSYGDLTVCRDLSIAFPAGRVQCLFGPSGCGKTTLVHLLTGTLRPDEGKVEGLDGLRVSCVFQEDRLLPWFTVAQNLRFVLGGHLEEADVADRVDRVLEQVGLLEFRDSLPGALSGGMRQRAALARALVHEGDLLVLDEPFKGLHAAIKKKLMADLRDAWKRMPQQVFLITHDAEEALMLADDIHLLQGPPLQVAGLVKLDIPVRDRVSGADELEQYRTLLHRFSMNELSVADIPGEGIYAAE